MGVLSAEQNDALLRLAAQRDTGRAELRVDRRPDFFALPRRFGQTTVYGAQAGDEILASLSVSHQQRFLAGERASTIYVHDLRSAPGCPALLLLRLARFALRAEGSPGWVFATILDGNPNEERLVAATARLFGGSHVLGRIEHVCFARSAERAAPPEGLEVTEVDPELGLAAYLDFARFLSMAPADLAGWTRLRGRWLLARQGGQTVGVTLAAAEPDRRLWRTASSAEIKLGYLAYFASRSPGDDARVEAAFLHHLGAAPWADWPLLGRGYLAGSAPSAGTVALTSTTYAFGIAPVDLTLGFAELTLV
jgi:hypothetical protein